MCSKLRLACSAFCRCSRAGATGPAPNSPTVSGSPLGRCATTSSGCASWATRSTEPKGRPAAIGSDRALSSRPSFSTTTRRSPWRSGCAARPRGSVAGIEEASARALAKMQQLLPVPLRRRVSALEAFSVHAPAFGPTVDADILTTLASACRDQEQTRIGYRRHDGTESSRNIEPHRLVNAGRRWYLVAWDTGREAWRTFRVDRIRLPPNHAGRRFAQRQLPDDDPAAYVIRGVSLRDSP